MLKPNKPFFTFFIIFFEYAQITNFIYYYQYNVQLGDTKCFTKM